MPLRYLDVCSGISAPTQAWKPLGWECAAYSEVDPFACDDFTLIERNGKPAVDGPRYKALGNSMAVPVMRWLGERIAKVDELYQAIYWRP